MLTPAAVGLVQNDRGEVLLIQRRDNRRWSLPAGTLELEDTVFEGMVREVKEETDLDVISATLIAVHSGPRFAHRDAFGDEHQLIQFIFRVDEWEGSLIRETDETVDARFVRIDEVPEMTASANRAVADLNRYSGQVLLD